MEASPNKIIVRLRIDPNDDVIALFDQVNEPVLDGYLDPNIWVPAGKIRSNPSHFSLTKRHLRTYP